MVTVSERTLAVPGYWVSFVRNRASTQQCHLPFPGLEKSTQRRTFADIGAYRNLSAADLARPRTGGHWFTMDRSWRQSKDYLAWESTPECKAEISSSMALDWPIA